MSKDNGKIFHGYAQDGIEVLTSMLPQSGTRGTPPLASTIPAVPVVAAPAAPTAPASSTTSGGASGSKN